MDIAEHIQPPRYDEPAFELVGRSAAMSNHGLALRRWLDERDRLLTARDALDDELAACQLRIAEILDGGAADESLSGGILALPFGWRSDRSVRLGPVGIDPRRQLAHNAVGKVRFTQTEWQLLLCLLGWYVGKPGPLATLTTHLRGVGRTLTARPLETAERS